MLELGWVSPVAGSARGAQTSLGIRYVMQKVKAYGVSYDPAFSSSNLSLLDRGMIFAIAHVRGGEEMGRAWYEGGKLLAKPNTFGDFIAAAEWLIANKYTATKYLAIEGGSNGGLLTGAVLVQRPDLFGAVVCRGATRLRAGLTVGASGAPEGSGPLSWGGRPGLLDGRGAPAVRSAAPG